MVSKMDKSFSKTQPAVREVNKMDREDDEKCQWFIVSLMRLVQKKIWLAFYT